MIRRSRWGTFLPAPTSARSSSIREVGVSHAKGWARRPTPFGCTGPTRSAGGTTGEDVVVRAIRSPGAAGELICRGPIPGGYGLRPCPRVREAKDPAPGPSGLGYHDVEDSPLCQAGGRDGAYPNPPP